LRNTVLGLILGAWCNYAVAHNAADHGLMIKIKYEGRNQIKDLKNAGYDITGIDLENGFIDIILNNEADAELLVNKTNLNIVSKTALNPEFAPDSDYKTPDEIVEIFTQFANDYPGITELEVIGQTVQGRDILALKITDNPQERELDEPGILFNAMHHAREIMTPEVIIDTAEFLLTNYGTDAAVTSWVDSNEIWLVPQVNPDGNNKVWTKDSYWRKNLGAKGRGVDLNRNYPYEWNGCGGSSGSVWSDTYRGPSAGSEPETQALMRLVARTQPVFNISYHSYSELVLYPYGCDGERTPTREIVEGVGIEMAKLIIKDSGRGTYKPGTPWDILYAVDGSDSDWMYNEYQVIPYVVELNSSSQGFQPKYKWRQPTVEKMRPAWGLLLDKLSGSGVRGVIRDNSGRANPNATITVASLGDNLLASNTMNVKPDGTYHLILLPGMYNISFNQNGEIIEKEVTIGDTRVDLDIDFAAVAH